MIYLYLLFQVVPELGNNYLRDKMKAPATINIYASFIGVCEMHLQDFLSNNQQTAADQ